MSTSQGSSNGDATRRDSTELGVEASTPPNTAHTQQADRSRSADRHAAHGNEARDERRPNRVPRQPNIPSAERSGVEASAVEASHTQEMQEDTRVHQPPDEPAVNTDSGAAAMARMEALNASNMSLSYGGGVGTGGIAGAGGTAVPPLPNRQTPTAQYPQTYGQQLTHGSVGGQQMPAQPPYGQAYEDMNGDCWVWNTYAQAYEPDLATMAARHPLPASSRGSTSSELAGEFQHLQASDPHTANDGAADLLHASGQASLQLVSPTLANAVATQDAAELSAAVEQAASQMESPAPAPVPEGMAVDSTSEASGSGDETSRDRVYLLFSKQGNKVAFKRSAVISSVEIDLEGSWEFSPGLPVVQQCPEIGPFPIVVDRGAADMIGTKIELYSETGDPVEFQVFRMDAQGRRIQSREKHARTMQAREESEEDEQRRTIITFYDIPLSVCGYVSRTEGPLAEVIKIIERAQFEVAGHAKRVNVHQPIIDGRPDTKLTAYLTMPEGTSNDALKRLRWQNVRFLQWRRGEKPITGSLPKRLQIRLGRAPCCLRSTLACPGREVCTARDDAWRVAGYGQSKRTDKRDREESKAEAQRHALKAAKAAALQARLSSLCEDFRNGQVRCSSTMHSAVPYACVRAQCKVEGCTGRHAVLRLSRSQIECRSARDGEWKCPFADAACPYARHTTN